METVEEVPGFEFPHMNHPWLNNSDVIRLLKLALSNHNTHGLLQQLLALSR